MTGWSDLVAASDRFWSKVDRTDGGCWPWLGTTNPKGYGRFVVQRKGYQAHRVAYELAVGPIPEGLALDHLCRNRSCVNPAHLEPVTNRENILRGDTLPAANAAKTECSKGHPFTPENTAIRPTTGERRCRRCGAESNKRYRASHPGHYTAYKRVWRARRREEMTNA